MRTVTILLCLMGTVYAHDPYSDWLNANGYSCCNKQDCRPLAFNEYRVVAGRAEIKVGETWCPILPVHHLKQGRAPDEFGAHVCIRVETGGVRWPNQCARLVCYKPAMPGG